MIRLILALALMALSSFASAANAQTEIVTRSYKIDLVMLFPGGSHNPNEGVEVRGSETYAAIYGSARYLFSSADTKALFQRNPEWYLPGGDGLCLQGWYNRASGAPFKGELPPPGDPRARTFANGQWYFHGGKDPERQFEKDPYTIDERARLAMEWWANKRKGSGKPQS